MIMGGSKQYLESGGFKNQTYEQTEVTSNGIKILRKIGNKSSNLPMYSNTPYTMYASRDSESGALKQITVYGGKDGRQKAKELDWGHGHGKIKEGNIHVHRYVNGKKDINYYRKPSKKEKRIVMMAIYGR